MMRTAARGVPYPARVYQHGGRLGIHLVFGFRPSGISGTLMSVPLRKSKPRVGRISVGGQFVLLCVA